MGKTAGLLEFPRQNKVYEVPEARVKYYEEFALALTDSEAKTQGACCMDCGIPFRNNSCPVSNIILDFNGLAYRQNWKVAIEILHSTNNFPEFAGRTCPAPYEAACAPGINELPVGIKSIEHAIIDEAWERGWMAPQVPKHKTGKTVAVVGSGPVDMVTIRQLARAGHDMTLFEKNGRTGGPLRYGILDFKLKKTQIDRRMQQVEVESMIFHTGVVVGDKTVPTGITNDTRETVTAEDILKQSGTVMLTGGSEVPCDLPVPGRDLDGMHYALKFPVLQNKKATGDAPNPIRTDDKCVIVVGGGDTGSDCVGTSSHYDAASVIQFELLPCPPEEGNKPLVWPYWPIKLRMSSSHDEGCQHDWSITARVLIDEDGRITDLTIIHLEWEDDRMVEVAGSEFTLKADLVLLAMGFTNPVGGLLDAFGVTKSVRSNARAATGDDNVYTTNVPKVFAAGDMCRDQLLVVQAIREGRQTARSVDAFLMDHSDLPR